MTISQVRALPVGNALQIFLEPPAAAEFWRVLRKTTDDFTGHDDQDAYVIEDGTDLAPTDARQVINGVTNYYRAYYWTGSTWVASASAHGVAAATYGDESVDAMAIVRDRLEAALTVEVQRGVLQHLAGGIPILLAPPTFEDTRWPVVTVHLENESPRTRALGEMIATDVFDSSTDKYTEGEGWLADVSLTIIGWCLNADERAELRKALRRAVVANLPVFASFGLVEVSFSQRDTEDFQSYAAPVYQSMCTFTCQAPVLITDNADPVVDVDVSATSTQEGP